MYFIDRLKGWWTLDNACTGERTAPGLQTIVFELASGMGTRPRIVDIIERNIVSLKREGEGTSIV